jgi:Domain of unknown function (DUF4189)
MKPLLLLIIFVGLIWFDCAAHAEGGCPSGMIPYRGADISSCGPIPPGHYQYSQRPQAPPVQWTSKWGAIATDSSVGSLGTSINSDSKEKAESNALADCRVNGGSKCEIELWYSNSCGAMVVGDDGHDTAQGATENQAVQKAMKVCSSDGDRGCHVYYSGCSLPKQIQ